MIPRHRQVAVLLALVSVLFIVFSVRLLMSAPDVNPSDASHIYEATVNSTDVAHDDVRNTPSNDSTVKETLSESPHNQTDVQTPPAPLPNYNAHIFYYPWYGAPETDGKYIHWNHKVLVNNGAEFVPPVDIGADFYPSYGLYSSADPVATAHHMSNMRRAGTGTVVLSWWGRGTADEQGGYTDRLTDSILQAAHAEQLKVAFHIEPYKGRCARSVRDDITYIYQKYGSHPAFYRTDKKGKQVGLFYLYDSYLSSAQDWSSQFPAEDAIVIGLIVNPSDQSLIANGGLDGGYTYFASSGFTFGSSPRNWPNLAKWAMQRDLLFIPCVGPGYIDTRIRPWNAVNTKSREQGAYYDRMWTQAKGVKTKLVAVTSYNEWHEGTQIEPAKPARGSKNYVYNDYSPLDEWYYIDRTAYWSHSM